MISSSTNPMRSSPTVTFGKPAFGRDREEAALPGPDHRALVERADDLRCFGVDQSRRVQAAIVVVPVAPGAGEALAEPGVGHLATELGLEASAGRAGASRRCTVDGAMIEFGG